MFSLDSPYAPRYLFSMSKDSRLCVCLVTCPSSESAHELAQRVVHERLAACVNIIGNVSSVYRWSDPGEAERVMTDTETLLVMKTAEPLVDALKSRILEAHPYQVPEFIALSAATVSDAYAQWVLNSVS